MTTKTKEAPEAVVRLYVETMPRGDILEVINGDYWAIFIDVIPGDRGTLPCKWPGSETNEVLYVNRAFITRAWQA